jgi:hypothetical protein
MTNRPLTRRLSLVLTLLLSLGVLVTALVGPAETLAQTRKPSCSTAAARIKAKRARRTCAQSHKGKAKHHTKHKKKGAKAGAPIGTVTVAAVCEDGSAPAPEASGEFTCTDGSEPACEDGATPTASHNGKSLLCPVVIESEESSAAEAECEEEGLECTGIASAPSEQSCEASASESSSFVCEPES